MSMICLNEIIEIIDIMIPPMENINVLFFGFIKSSKKSKYNSKFILSSFLN